MNANSAHAQQTISDDIVSEGPWLFRVGLGNFWFLWMLDELIWGGDAIPHRYHASDDGGD
jgi:hypothetical protein